MERLKEEYENIEKQINKYIYVFSTDEIIEKYKNIEINNAIEDLKYINIQFKNYSSVILELTNQVRKFRKEILILFNNVKFIDTWSYRDIDKRTKEFKTDQIVDIDYKDLELKSINEFYEITEGIIIDLTNYILKLTRNKHVINFFKEFHSEHNDYYYLKEIKDIEKGNEIIDFIKYVEYSTFSLSSYYNQLANDTSILIDSIKSIEKNIIKYSDKLQFTNNSIEYKNEDIFLRYTNNNCVKTYRSYSVFLTKLKRIMSINNEDPLNIEESVFQSQLRRNNISMYRSYMNQVGNVKFID